MVVVVDVAAVVVLVELWQVGALCWCLCWSHWEALWEETSPGTSLKGEVLCNLGSLFEVKLWSAVVNILTPKVPHMKLCCSGPSGGYPQLRIPEVKPYR